MKNLIKKLLSWLFIVLIVILVVLLLFKTDIEIDSCLDSGGRWDYDDKVCLYQEL